MVDRVKVKITEKNSQELEFTEEYDLTADNTYFDNTGSGLTSDNTGAAIRELASTVASSASPGFSFGRSGNVSNNTWLNNEGVPSNKSGRYVYISSAVVSRVFVSSEDVSTYDIRVYAHDGDQINLTTLGTVSIVASRGGEFTVSWPVSSGKQLAVRIINGSAKNVVAGLELQGTS